MATKTLYFLPDTTVTGSTALASLQDGGSAPATASATSGWVTAKTATANYSTFKKATKQAANTFATTVLPPATIDNTNGNAFRTQNTISGVFANTNWSFAFKLISTVAASQVDTVRVRVFKSTDATGQTGLVELTGATQESGNITGSTSEQSATITWTPGGTFTFNAEYLFVSVALKTVTAGTSTTSDWLLRTGSTAAITTPDVSVAMASATTDGADTLAAVAAPGVDASSAKTDGTDTIADTVGPLVTASAAVTDGADAMAAAGSSTVAVAAANTDGADVLAGVAAVLVAATSATTDSADTLAAIASPRVGATSATTDGLDAFAAVFTDPDDDSTSALEGADVLAAQVGPIVGVSMAATDGADALSGAATARIDAAASPVDGPDALAAIAGSVIGAAGALIDGSDVASATVSALIEAAFANVNGPDALDGEVDTSAGQAPTPAPTPAPIPASSDGGASRIRAHFSYEPLHEDPAVEILRQQIAEEDHMILHLIQHFVEEMA